VGASEVRTGAWDEAGSLTRAEMRRRFHRPQMLHQLAERLFGQHGKLSHPDKQCAWAWDAALADRRKMRNTVGRVADGLAAVDTGAVRERPHGTGDLYGVAPIAP
jgi:hypothetical protein